MSRLSRIRLSRIRPSRIGWRDAVRLALLLVVLAPPAGANKVLLLGLDGATWQLLDPLIAGGYLPNLASIAAGARGSFDCADAWPQFSCFCPPVWNTIATGRPYSDHQMTNVTTPSSDRQVAALWQVMRLVDERAIAFGWRNIHPVEPSFLAAIPEAGTADAADQLYTIYGTPEHDACDVDPFQCERPDGLREDLGILPGAARGNAWHQHAADRISMEAVESWPDPIPALTLVLLHSIDKVEHLKWNLLEPNPGDPIDLVELDAEASAYAGPVPVNPAETNSVVLHGTNASQYIEFDDWLGGVSSRFDHIVIVSDHGMGRNPAAGLSGQHTLNILNARDAILAISGPGVTSGDIGAVSIFDVAPTVAWLAGAPVSTELPGRVLTEAFDASYLAQNPIALVGTWEPNLVPALGGAGLGLLAACVLCLGALGLRWRARSDRRAETRPG